MTVTIATWNINSLRFREAAVLRFLREEAPDVLCLQETKARSTSCRSRAHRALGYQHVVARGQTAYNGVAIVARSPIERLIEAKRARGWTDIPVYSDSDGAFTARLRQRR